MPSLMQWHPRPDFRAKAPLARADFLFTSAFFRGRLSLAFSGSGRAEHAGRTRAALGVRESNHDGYGLVFAISGTTSGFLGWSRW
jgi:hypothetical protein